MSRQRLFLAIQLPAEFQEELSSISERLRILFGESIRITPIENLHLTICFFGSLESEQADQLVKAMTSSESPSEVFPLRLTVVGAFPERGNPSVFWVGVEVNEGVLRCREYAVRMASQCGIKSDDKPFSPHITLARRQRAVRLTQGPAVLRELTVRPLWFDVSGLTLFRSDSHAGGTRYTPIQALRLT